MRIKTAEASGVALDWLAAMARGFGVKFDGTNDPWLTEDGIAHLPLHAYNPSTDWSQGGPIIEREEIGVCRNAPCSKGREWEASPSITAKGAGGRYGYGPTPLIAAMRCYVASRLGDEVEVPDELMKEKT